MYLSEAKNDFSYLFIYLFIYLFMYLFTYSRRPHTERLGSWGHRHRSERAINRKTPCRYTVWFLTDTLEY